MATTPEGRFKQWIVKGKPEKAMMQTIETSTGSGVPDLFYCDKGRECWIELKATPHLTEKKIRTSQWIWFKNLLKAGGRGLVVIKRTKTQTVEAYDIERLFSKKRNPLYEARIVGQHVIFDCKLIPDFSLDVSNGVDYFYSQLESHLATKDRLKDYRKGKKNENNCNNSRIINYSSNFYDPE